MILVPDYEDKTARVFRNRPRLESSERACPETAPQQDTESSNQHAPEIETETVLQVHGLQL